MEKLKVKFKFPTPRTRQREEKEEKKTSKNKDPTGNDRQKRYREKWKNSPMLKQKNVKKCKQFREKLKLRRNQSKKLNEELKKKERERKALYRKKLKEKKSGDTNVKQSEVGRNNQSHVKQSEVMRKNQPKKGRTESGVKETIARLQKKIKTVQQKNRRQDKKSPTKTVRSPEALRKRASRVRKTLPSSPTKWADTVSHILKNASPKKKAAFKTLKNKKSNKQNMSRSKRRRLIWKRKVAEFVNRDDILRQMPNKKDVIKVNGQSIAKRHLLLGQKEAYQKFREEQEQYPFRYTTFRKAIPKHIKKMKLSDRRVCVCLKCFNMSEMVSSLNQVKKKGMEPFTIRNMYKDSTCETTDQFPELSCIEGNCSVCKDKFKNKHQALITEKGHQVVKYCQWQLVKRKFKTAKGQTVEKKVWQQVVYKEKISVIFDKVCSRLQDIVGHVFRNDFQFYQHKKMAETLPQDQAIVYADFSQNYALIENDEIQASHYVKNQVTLHTMYLIRHAETSTPEKPQLTREAIAIISDDLKHNTTAVYNFTVKLIGYMKNNPQKVELPRILHRITDNCGFEYKCNQAFAHLHQYEEIMGVKIVYHYSEPGHGKGPHDGIGATIKHGLDRLVVQDRVHLNNAYEAYLAANKHLSKVARDAYPSQQKLCEFSKRTILYVPARSYQSIPKLDTKPVKGTLNLRFIQSVSKDKVEIANLSCSCPPCMHEAEGDCVFQKWRKTSTRQITKLSDEVHIPQGSDSQQYAATRKGYKVMDTPDDGNCAFWAISSQTGNLSHDELRLKSVEYIRELPQAEKNEMEAFLTTSLDDYLNDMSHDGRYADHIILQAVSNVLVTRIRIIHESDEDITLSPKLVSPASATCTIGYLPDIQHYVGLQSFQRFVPEDFVTVNLTQKSRKYMYIAKVLEVDGDVKLRFMKSTTTPDVFTWPEKEDISWQPQEDVIMKLSPPTLIQGRGIKLRFSQEELNLNALKMSAMNK